MFRRGMLGIGEAAKIANRSPDHFRHLARRGRLPFRAVRGGRWGRYWLVDEGTFRDWLATPEQQSCNTDTEASSL